MTYYGLVDQYDLDSSSNIYLDLNMTLYAIEQGSSTIDALKGHEVYNQTLLSFEELGVCDYRLNGNSANGDIIFKDGGTQIGRIRNVSSGEFTFQSDVSDKDIVFNGNDGGVTVTALTLDMSEAGAAASRRPCRHRQRRWPHRAPRLLISAVRGRAGASGRGRERAGRARRVRGSSEACRGG